MNVVPLFDAKAQKFDQKGYLPPKNIAVQFRIIGGESKVGVTGVVQIPVLGAMKVTNSETVFIELDQNRRPVHVYYPNQVESWVDMYSAWKDEYSGKYVWANEEDLQELWNAETKR